MIRTLKSYTIAAMLLQMTILPMASGYTCDAVYEPTCVITGIDDLYQWNYEIIDDTSMYGLDEINTIKFISCNFTELSSTTSVDPSGNQITRVDLSGNHIKHLLTFHFTLDDLVDVDLSRNEIENLDSSSIFVAHPKLRTIELSLNRIASISWNAFEGLSHLNTLLLNQNQLKEINQLMLSPLVELRVLGLNVNLIEIFENYPFSALNNLQKLHLLRNNFLEFDFDQLTHLPNDTLQEISLGDNNGIDFLSLVGHLKFATDNLELYKVIHPNLTVASKSVSIFDSKISTLIVSRKVENVVATNSSITKLIINENGSALRVGNFSKNLLTGPLSFESCEKLEILDLSFNQIRNISFPNQALMEELNLSHNNLTFIQNMTGLSNLKVLDLSFNCIENFEMNTFSGLISLRVLNLQRTCFKSLDYGTFSFQTELIVLDISYNNLNTIDLELLSAQQLLENLMIEGNNLTNIQSLDMIRNFLPNLKSIGLTHNHWHCKTLASLITKLSRLYADVRFFVENSIKHTTNVKGIGCTTLNTTQETLIIPKHFMSINHTMYMDKVEQINEIIANVNDLEFNKNHREIIADAIKDLQRDKSAMKSNLDERINQFKRFGKDIVNKFELLNEINYKRLMTMKATIIKLNKTNNEKYVLIAQSIESLEDKLKKMFQAKGNFTENIHGIARDEIKIDSDYDDDLSTLKTLEICLIALIFVLLIVALYFVLVYC